MANRKMFPARGKKPPPPKMMHELEQIAETRETGWSVTILEDGVILRFEEETEFIAMSSRGARQMALALLQRAVELEALLAPPAEKSVRGSAPGRSKGGRARADNLTAEQRREIARNAAQARWAKP
jgi:hypothetical protein